jgi:hypothetical protein
VTKVGDIHDGFIVYFPPSVAAAAPERTARSLSVATFQHPAKPGTTTSTHSTYRLKTAVLNESAAVNYFGALVTFLDMLIS